MLKLVLYSGQVHQQSGLWAVKPSPLEVGHSKGAGVLCHKVEEQGDEKQRAC